MDLEIVVPADDDFPAAIRPVLNAFGRPRPTADELADERLHHDDYRLLAARVDGEWVGDVADYPFELTLPGGAAVPAAGVTMVGVLPTHRRQGVTSQLMARLFDDAIDRGEPVAVLLASESSIYGRFGYGVATQIVTALLDTDRSAFLVPPRCGGRVRIEDDAVVASAVAEQVWARHLAWRPGTLTRRPWTWEVLRRDRESWRDGASAYFWAIHEDDDGVADGVAVYRFKDGADRGLARCEVHVADLFAVDAEVEAALVRYLCDIDLVHQVKLELRPVDDPLRWRLVDNRQLVVERLNDWLWARVLDVPAAFSARRYATADRLVVQVDDAFRPASGGRFGIEGGPDGASCVATTDAADLTLGADALGSLLLGTIAPSLLAAAGRVAASPAALGRADAFFASSPAPFSSTRF
ncbi:GNAT family N-acetyltransferase [Aquihabitans sp. G128]|uniref:GNAT family N-acetyltransferase n=1 Tax=Aquihabitans sp. G128 TaxID=2849779 RepID=UPI001C2237FA|nr:GNAT family N-acetyltransferase [Aquihabitans sp. G128]QXC63097.1 GNAT family N-acetyltransferase [Aquihabitans sp. G128]